MSANTKIVRLEAKNVKRLRAVEITPDGNLVVIGGANGEGKTSVLDSIMYALAGKKAVCDQPLRAGERKGGVTVDLGDLVATRAFTTHGDKLTVTNKDGVPASKPQAILDKLTGTLTFDPLAFVRQDARQQLDTLRGLVGLDFSKLDAKRKAAFEQRTAANRTGGELAAQLEGMALHDAPQEEVSVKELVEEQQRRREVNQANIAARAKLEHLQTQAVAMGKDAAAAEERLAVLRKELRRVLAHAEALAPIVAALKDEDEAEIFEQLASADTTNQQIRENRTRADAAERMRLAVAEAENLTKQILEVDDERRRQLSEAKFPVEGLGFDEAQVLFHGVPFDQASSAEQLRVSVAMAAAGNPDLRIMLIRDGSLLDAESLKLISDFAADRDYQIWLERVGDGAEVSVVIEDGMVKAGEKVAP